MGATNDLYCFNPITGKRDGRYCAWEGGGKCMKCEAADRIAELESQVDQLQAEKDQAIEHSLSLQRQVNELERNAARLQALREAATEAAMEFERFNRDVPSDTLELTWSKMMELAALLEKGKSEDQ